MRRQTVRDTSVRSSVLDPNVGGPTQRAADAALENLWRARVAANELRRARAKAESSDALPAFLRPQAG